MYYSLLSLLMIYFVLFPQASQSSMNFNILELVCYLFSSKPKKESKSEGEDHVPTTKDRSRGLLHKVLYALYSFIYHFDRKEVTLSFTFYWQMGPLSET